MRHFNYDVEKTTNALMELNELPFELRVLLRAKDNFKDINPSGIVIPLFSDYISATSKNNYT